MFKHTQPFTRVVLKYSKLPCEHSYAGLQPRSPQKKLVPCTVNHPSALYSGLSSATAQSHMFSWECVISLSQVGRSFPPSCSK